VPFPSCVSHNAALMGCSCDMLSMATCTKVNPSASWSERVTAILNMPKVEGLHLRVDRAAGSRQSGAGAAPVEYARARSVFVGNLHFDTQVVYLRGSQLLVRHRSRNMVVNPRAGAFAATWLRCRNGAVLLEEFLLENLGTEDHLHVVRHPVLSVMPIGPCSQL